MKISIIGGGIGGLATASLLAKHGHQVTLFEKNDQLGGRASVIKYRGFSFDMGPSWYLMPEVFKDFFKIFKLDITKLIDLVPLEPQYRAFFSDNTQFDIPRNKSGVKAIFKSIEPGCGNNFDEYLNQSSKLYKTALNDLLYQNTDTLFDLPFRELFNTGFIKHSLKNMEQYVSGFFKEEKLHQILQYPMVFLGGSPQTTPAFYSLMSHVDFNLGVFYPIGGFTVIVDLLKKIAMEQGVNLKLNSPITKIEVVNKKVTALYSNHNKYPTDIVVSNADYQHTESLLSDGRFRQYSDKYWANRVLAPSAFLVYLGIKGNIPEFLHHNLIFAPSWQNHFDNIFKKPSWPNEPSVYISNPSKTDTSVAPKNHENLCILVPIAAGLKETELSKAKYLEKIIDQIEIRTNAKIKGKIVFQKIFSVTDFEGYFNSPSGTALGLSHSLKQTGPFRPRNQSKKIENLFFVGATTTPGIGVPMCLISSQLVLNKILKQYGCI